MVRLYTTYLYFSFILLWVTGLQPLCLELQDKILMSQSATDTLQVTNDGATILRSIGVDNPAAKVLVGKSVRSIHCLVRNLQEFALPKTHLICPTLVLQEGLVISEAP